MNVSHRRLNIAVVGAGVSGITAAYLLQQKHDVTLFEKNDYFGGHTRTIVLSAGPDAGTPIDTGFIVLNQRTYPNLLKLFARLGVEIRPTDMSFSYYSPRTGLAYASRSLNTLFAQRINLFRPSHWQFLAGMLRFLRKTQSDYRAGRLEGITLGAYLRQSRFPKAVAERFVVPMAAAIWSASDMDMADFPMRTFAQFYENHGLLNVRHHPPWYYVHGGSHRYVKAFLDVFEGHAVKSHAVRSIARDNGGVTIALGDGRTARYDAVVLAVHADQALRLLSDPSPDERRLLSVWRYSRNRAVLHTDDSRMPPCRRAWASWNYVREVEKPLASPVSVTYHMNRLQRLDTVKQYFVTLNPSPPVAEKHCICEMLYTHPLYDFAAFASQPELSRLNGRRDTYYCGAYFGYGFHEDGVRSAVAVADRFGIML